MFTYCDSPLKLYNNKDHDFLSFVKITYVLNWKNLATPNNLCHWWYPNVPIVYAFELQRPHNFTVSSRIPSLMHSLAKTM